MKHLLSAFLALVGFNLFIWYSIIVGKGDATEMYFLNVGQGDSQLIELPGGVQFLIDGGPDRSVIFELAEVLPATDRYIDVVFVTHPQLDHFGGLVDVLERYRVGAVIATGRDSEDEAWRDFVEVIKRKKVPIVLVGAGDVIRYKDSLVSVLAPNDELLSSPEVNESSLVLKLQSGSVKALFTGDIGFEAENYIANAYDVDVDVLKVGHHGSKFSSGLEFLEEVTPVISVIQVGKNRFGHPTEAAIQRLIKVNSSVYRNDRDGTVRLRANDGTLSVSLKRR